MFTRIRSTSRLWLAAVVLASVATAGSAFADPPGRVVRLGHISGEVSFQPAGDTDGWSEASLNRPLIAGDGLYTDRASRVEMDVGAASVRLDERSNFRVLNLDDRIAQLELTEGVLNLRVRRIFDGETYEIDTPTLAFVIDEPGSYRVDIAPDGNSTMISVFDGGGTVYGENNASYALRDGQSYRFNDTSLRDYDAYDLPRQDDFDRWCYERDGRYERSESRRYVSEEVIGYADLDDHGSWSSVETYGSVWFPSRVDAGWAPYRQGRWSWIDPWGWTWVDNSAWGFAPFHYGRWAYVGTRWGWVPGPRHVRPIYAPALVAFVGGNNFGVQISGGGPVGWFPLGPRDVYVPWYRGSRDYFNNINVRNTTIINNTYITNVYNDYSRGRTVNNFNYAYRNNDRAFTAVPRDAFVNSRAVDRSQLRMDRAQFGRGDVLSRVDVKPVAASFTGTPEIRNRARLPSNDVVSRSVVARSAPAPRRLDVQSRIKEIERNGNQPLAVTQMRELSANRPNPGAARAERVRVVGSPGNAPSRASALPTREPGGRERSSVAGPEAKPGRVPDDARTTPRSRAPVATDDRGSQQVQPRDSNIDRKERRLPSSGYAPGRGGVERQPAARGPSSDSDVAKPIERGNTTRAPRNDLPERRLSPRDEPAPVVRQPERAQPTAIERRQAAPRQAPVERSQPVRSEPQRVERAPQRVEREAPQRVERAPQRVERETPQRVERAPQRVEREAPQRIERAAPQPRVAPQPQQRAAPPPQQQQAPRQQQQPQQAPQRQQKAPQRKEGDAESGEQRKRRDD